MRFNVDALLASLLSETIGMICQGKVGDCFILPSLSAKVQLSKLPLGFFKLTYDASVEAFLERSII
jgi:hypothetical protein